MGGIRRPEQTHCLPGRTSHTFATYVFLFRETIFTFHFPVLLNILSCFLCPCDVDLHIYLNGILHICLLLFLNIRGLDRAGSTCISSSQLKPSARASPKITHRCPCQGRGALKLPRTKCTHQTQVVGKEIAPQVKVGCCTFGSSHISRN